MTNNNKIFWEMLVAIQRVLAWKWKKKKTELIDYCKLILHNINSIK